MRDWEGCTVERALAATDAEHLAAIASVACPICGAPAGAECTYGWANADAGRSAAQFPGKAHTRRVCRYLATRPPDLVTGDAG